MTELIIRGRFENADGAPLTGAVVLALYAGDPPGNFATSFDLTQVKTRTDDSGAFQIAYGDPEAMPACLRTTGAWRRGCFFVLAVRDAHTIGYGLASGKELSAGPIHLVALPRRDVWGTAVDEAGRAVRGVRIRSENQILKVGRGPKSDEPFNIRLYRSPPGSEETVPEFLGITAETDRDGVFVLRDVPAAPGGGFLTATHSDHAVLSCAFDPQQPLPPLVLPAGARVTLRLLLPDGMPAHGFHFVLSAEPDEKSPYRGPERTPAGADFSPRVGGETDSSGRCEFHQLLPGRYAIWYMRGPTVAWAVPVIFVEGLASGEHREVVVTAVAGSVLCGTVTDDGTGQPIALAAVFYESKHYPGRGAGLSTYTDEEGQFATPTPLVPGSFRVRVFGEKLGRLVRRTHRVVLGPEARTEIHFTLPFKPKRTRPG